MVNHGVTRGAVRSVLLGAVLAVPIAWAGGKAASDARGTEGRPADETRVIAAAARSLADYQKAAARYAIALDLDPPRRLSLREEPLLRWTNPVRRAEDGVVFLWVDGGRPAAIASFYRYKVEGRTGEDHEFQSLAPVGLTARVADRVVRSPKSAGITFQPLPDAPRPSEDPALRGRQLRDLSRRFRAYHDVHRNKTELRLLTQPLDRYTAKAPEPGEGALFAFVQTTDPEVLLLIESRTGGRAPAWYYGFARMSSVDLLAEYQGRKVWGVDGEGDRHNPTKPYVTLWASELPR